MEEEDFQRKEQQKTPRIRSFTSSTSTALPRAQKLASWYLDEAVDPLQHASNVQFVNNNNKAKQSTETPLQFVTFTYLKLRNQG